MKYINIQKAASNWGLTVRRVQDMCKSGAICGAERFGKVWMIPEDAQKPQDGRKREVKKLNADINGRFMMPSPRQNPFFLHTDLYHTPGMADELIDSFADYPETQKIIRAQFAYRRGDFEELCTDVNHFLENHVGLYSTISAGIVLSYCAIWKGDLALWRQARRHIYSAPCKDERDRRIVSLWLAVIDSNINDIRSFPDWFEHGDFYWLPGDSYGTARVFYVKRLYIYAHELACGKLQLADVQGLGLMRMLPYIIEPMISQARMERTVIPEIYLHLMGAVVCHNLADDAHAVKHIDRAINLALPDGLFGILIEYRSQLDNLLDDRLSEISPEALETVKKRHKIMMAGWTKLHNELLGRNISVTLTAREREVAKLAAFGLSNAEISERLCLEVSSVKQYIFSAMNKVGAEKRNELGLYI